MDKKKQEQPVMIEWWGWEVWQCVDKQNVVHETKQEYSFSCKIVWW